jgi:2-amino-4-hydroxy-6-hydroxymethyldihydropteridine diphosphokinase
MATLALIGLGSNLGDRTAHLDRAVAALAATPGMAVRAVSTYHETSPVGGPGGQGAFLNAAAALETSLEPPALLDALHAIEAASGRIREVRWGERTLDLDLLLFGDAVIRTELLRVPHPLMALRRFVLAPLAEVAPEAVDPVTRRTVRGLLANLDRRPSYVALAATDNVRDIQAGRFEGVKSLHDRLQRELPATSVDVRLVELIQSRSISLREGPPPDKEWFRLKAEALDAAGWMSRMPRDGWVVSRDWFDAAYFLAPSVTIPGWNPLGSRHDRERFQQFLTLRETVLPPTFVVARRDDLQPLGLADPRDAWQRPIGWDTPILEVDDFESESTFQYVMAACAATRAG